MPHIVHCNGGNHTISLTKVSWPTPCDKSQFLLLWEEGPGKLLTRLFKVVASLVIFVGKVCSQTLLSFVRVLNACARIVAIEEGWTNQSRPSQVITSIYTAFLQLTKQFLHHNEWSLNRSKQDMQVHSSSSASESYPLHSSFGESNILPWVNLFQLHL